MPTLALSMIARDAESELATCLASVKGMVDEIVIADTGSTDGTVELARASGATVLFVPWNNDFAEARNRCLEAVKSDWVLVLDADEQIDPAEGSKVRACANQRETDGFLVPIRNYVNGLNERVWDKPALPNQCPPDFAKQYPAYIDHQNVRLFRRDANIFFTGRVHETVGHAIRAVGGRLRTANFLVHHYGMAASQERKAHKNEFYRELGRAKVADDPNDAQAKFELGVLELDSFHDYANALSLFESALILKPEFGEAWLFAGVSLLRLSRWQEALTRFQEARRLRHSPALTAELQGDAHFSLQDFIAAAGCYQRALDKHGNSSVLESKLAICELQRGHAARAIARLEKCVRRDPTNGELYDRLITALVTAGDLERAAHAAETKIGKVIPDYKCYLRAASIRAQLQQWQQVRELLKQGLDAFPGAPKLVEAYREAARRRPETAQFGENMQIRLKASEAGPIR